MLPSKMGIYCHHHLFSFSWCVIFTSMIKIKEQNVFKTKPTSISAKKYYFCSCSFLQSWLLFNFSFSFLLDIFLRLWISSNRWQSLSIMAKNHKNIQNKLRSYAAYFCKVRPTMLGGICLKTWLNIK